MKLECFKCKSTHLQLRNIGSSSEPELVCGKCKTSQKPKLERVYREYDSEVENASE